MLGLSEVTASGVDRIVRSRFQPKNTRTMLNHNGSQDHERHAEHIRRCMACGSEYALTSAEQSFRSEHRLGTSSLCSECRASQRAGRNADIIALYEKSSSADAADFSPSKSSASRSPQPGKSQVRGQLFTTVCDACGSETRVPFVPRGDRPVYCKDCYNARRGR